MPRALGMSEPVNTPPAVELEPNTTSLSHVSATLMSPRSFSLSLSQVSATLFYRDHLHLPLLPLGPPHKYQELLHLHGPPSQSITTLFSPKLPLGPLADLHVGHHVFVILRGLPGSGKSSLSLATR